MATGITNRGLQIISDRLRGSGTEPRWMAWGIDAAPTPDFNPTDTALHDESGDEARVAGTSTTETENTTGDTYQVVATLTVVDNPKDIAEVGLFDASTSGNLFFRSVFTPVPLDVDESIQFTLRTTFDQA